MSARHRRGAPACRRGAPPEDASAKLGKLESVKTKELEDLDVAEEDALDRSDPGRDGSCEAACDGTREQGRGR